MRDVSRTYDVVIIGGGVVGLTAAWELHHRLKGEGRIAILDQSEPGREASWAGAGILSPGDPVHPVPAMRELARRSAARWPELSLELADQTGIDNGYVQCGGIEVCGSDAQMREEIAGWQNIGVTAVALSALGPDEYIPDIEIDRQRAFLLPQMAQVRNPHHLKALLAAVSASADLLPGVAAHDWLLSGETVVGVQTTSGIVRGGQFLLAAGAWSGRLLSPWISAEIEPVRGQIVLLREKRNTLRRIIEQGKRYLVPRRDGRVLVGSTEEWAGFEKRNTPPAIQELLGFATAIVPSLREATVENMWSGLRPFAKRERPYLGLVPGTNNLYVAAGHFRSGLFLSPATADVVARIMLKEDFGPPDLALTAELAP